MAKSINQILLMGNLTRDPEVKTLTDGKKVANFSIALNRSYVDSNGEVQEATDYADIVAWGKLAEQIEKYLTKGRRVLVEARWSSRSWESEDGKKHNKVEALATDVTFLDNVNNEHTE